MFEDVFDGGGFAPATWTNYFDRALGRACEELAPGALVALGYEQRCDWYEALPETIAPPPGERWTDDTPTASALEHLAAHCAALEYAYTLRKRTLAEYQHLATLAIAPSAMSW